MVYPCRGVYCRGNIIDSDASVIISQSFLSGRPFSCKYDRKRGLKTRANHVMFIITNFMYLLSAANWGYSVADLVDRMRVDIRDPQDSDSPMHDTVTKWSPLFNAVVLVNYIFSDAVVVWRAWIISFRNYRKYLCVTIFFLVLTTLTVTSTIIFRIIALVEAPFTALPKSSYLARGIDILQISNIGFSLISNLSATAVVGATAWRHRRSIRAAFADNKKSTKADQILTMVVESGLLYCVSGLTVLIASLIRLPEGTLGDIYTPINVQIAGAYPPVVLLLVSMQRSLSETTFLNTFEGSTPSRSIQFGGYGTNSNRVIHFARNPELSRTELGSEGEMLSPDIERRSIDDNPREKI
ncbi:hypothetical protein B0H13DRAFT_1622855 [Mycena leptocephala]|nr:hypothetical protein B0H13DRAFT_1622855 [Mycena leptocephala]